MARVHLAIKIIQRSIKVIMLGIKDKVQESCLLKIYINIKVNFQMIN